MKHYAIQVDANLQVTFWRLMRLILHLPLHLRKLVMSDTPDPSGAPSVIGQKNHNSLNNVATMSDAPSSSAERSAVVCIPSLVANDYGATRSDGPSPMPSFSAHHSREYMSHLLGVRVLFVWARDGSCRPSDRMQT
jgi:hypothetical protein